MVATLTEEEIRFGRSQLRPPQEGFSPTVDLHLLLPYFSAQTMEISFGFCNFLASMLPNPLL